MCQGLHTGLETPSEQESDTCDKKDREDVREKGRKEHCQERPPTSVFFFNWPHAPETSLPRFFRMNVAVPFWMRIPWKRSIASSSDGSYGISSFIFKGIKFTFTLMPCTRRDSSSASSGKSVKPLIMTHSNMTRICRACA